MAEKVKAHFLKERIITEDSDEARELNARSCFGSIQAGKVHLGLLEALYLHDKEKIEIVDGRGKAMNSMKIRKKAERLEANFWTRYVVFRNLRNRGYIVKTALKFGADFRVYDRGIKPGEDHAKWVVFAVHEGDSLTWNEFSAKNRVAHSTKKRLLLGVVDDEEDVSFWEARWIRP